MKEYEATVLLKFRYTSYYDPETTAADKSYKRLLRQAQTFNLTVEELVSPEWRVIEAATAEDENNNSPH